MAGKRRADAPASSRPSKTSKNGKNGRPTEPLTAKQRVLKVLKWSGITFLVLTLIAVGGFIFLYRAIDIPDADADFEAQSTIVYYADGKTTLGKFAIQDRDAISYNEMPQNIKDAVVAAENRSFWTDNGVDVKGIIRAALNNASGGSTEGASTITQQLVKILYLNQEQSYTRKVKEAILALKIQRSLSKEEVLTDYLNTIYFGRGAYGIEAASQAYLATSRRSSSTCAKPRCSPACSTTRTTWTRPTARTLEPTRGSLRVHPGQHGRHRRHHRVESEKAAAEAPAVQEGKRPRHVRRSERFRADDGPPGADRLGFERRRDRSRRAPGHHDVHEEGHGRGRGGA